MKFRSWLVTGVVAVAFVSLTAAVGQSSNDTNNNTYQQLNLFGDVFEKIRSSYVEPVSDEKLIEAAINGMLTSLDPHSSYMDPKEWDDMQVQTKGEFGGLGIEVTMENGVIKVVSPIDGTPAAKAGIQPGDLIVQIDNKPIMGLTLSDAVDKMRGPVDSKIVLTVRRGKQPPFDVTLQRAIIKIESVRSDVLNGSVGYVRITSFSEQTGSGLQNALAKIKELPFGVAHQRHEDAALPSALAAKSPHDLFQLLLQLVGLAPQGDGAAVASLGKPFNALKGFFAPYTAWWRR
jgi:carboxyl-terminal processing protease